MHNLDEETQRECNNGQENAEKGPRSAARGIALDFAHRLEDFAFVVLDAVVSRKLAIQDGH